MLTSMRGECDYCEKPIHVELEVCNVCIHNMREIQKDARLQEIKLDRHTMKNVVTLELPRDSST